MHLLSPVNNDLTPFIAHVSLTATFHMLQDVKALRHVVNRGIMRRALQHWRVELPFCHRDAAVAACECLYTG